jgi:hypothetical protein
LPIAQCFLHIENSVSYILANCPLNLVSRIALPIAY